MTPELIKQWVDVAGFYDINGDEWVVPCSETLYRFAALVAAHQRELDASEADSWKRSKLLLHAGELSMQERRACEAVSSGIAAAIRRKDDERSGTVYPTVDELFEALNAPAHTDHPVRHWDRTCPACNASIETGEQP